MSTRKLDLRDMTHPLLASQGESPLERAVAAKLVGDMNLLRLKAVARVLARGLEPEIFWGDLLQEAFARVLNGSRRQPEGVPFDVFMAGVMKSLRADYWRRRRRKPAHTVATETASEDDAASEAPDPAPDPERAVLAQTALKEVLKLFAADREASLVIEGLADGLSAEDICYAYGLTRTAYDSARKRMRRVLLREGLRMREI
jgi:RNA polymerase sigma-70 factor (ECF subfamily)